MDDYVRALESEQSNANGLLIQVLASGYENWEYIFAIEGGPDRRFYFDFVRDIVAEKGFEFIECGGKGALYKFKEAVEDYSWEVSPKFRYICDKDFDDYLGLKKDEIWYTDKYSIESYLSDVKFIEYCVDKHGKSVSIAVKKQFIDSYRKIFSRMARDVRPYCAFMCCVRASGEHPAFDDFGFDKIFDVSKVGVPRRKGTLDSAKKALGVENDVSYSSILSRSRNFDLEDVCGWLRGKLSLQIARKSYELALSAMSENQKKGLPASTVLGSDAFGGAFAFWKALPGLAAYCS